MGRNERHTGIDPLTAYLQEWKRTWYLSIQRGMLSSRTSQDGQSSGLILLWFEWCSFHQSRNKIAIDIGCPFPFHFQRTGILRAEVELSGMGAGWAQTISAGMGRSTETWLMFDLTLFSVWVLLLPLFAWSCFVHPIALYMHTHRPPQGVLRCSLCSCEDKSGSKLLNLSEGTFKELSF